MSVRDLFEKNYISKVVSSKSLEKLGENAESADNVVVTRRKVREFVPPLDYATASNFAVYGSAEKYYEDAVKRITNEYPYDGSESEIQEFHLSSSYLDKFVLDRRYPTTTGYILLSADGWGTKVALDATTGYGAPGTSSYEYISLEGGPHTNLLSGQALADAYSGSHPQDNVYDVSKNRASNLALNPASGSTLEFWFKKSAYNLNNTKKEVIFDQWNNRLSSSAAYGRFRVELDFTVGAADPPFKLTYMSGTSGFSNQVIGSGVTRTTVTAGTWNHYAISILSGATGLTASLYQNGTLDNTRTVASTVSEITGAMLANIGSLRTHPSGTAAGAPQPTQGWGKLSASLDEFRFWKARRTSEEIGRNWFTQVRGGTNTDDANTTLGVYYKFNEGITTTSSLDSIVLDYSGRITNGAWTGYDAYSRNTGSAMVSSSAALFEFHDPIIYSTHPDVVRVRDGLKLSGSVYDEHNNASIYHSLPAWILEEDSSGDLKNLVQIIASYFDKLQSQIKAVPQLKDVQYLSSSFKEYPFASHLVESAGISAPDVFVDSNVLEQIMSRDEDRDFVLQFDEIKNRIYQNIYNNLSYIYKSKGTEKSFRNLIHCYGVGEDLIRLNTYGNNVTYRLDTNVRSSVSSKNIADFSPANNRDATIFLTGSSDNLASVGFISGSAGDAGAASGLEDYIGFTLEGEVIFPQVLDVCSITSSCPTNPLTVSLFGMHSAEPGNPTQTTWATNDYADLRVYAVRPSEDSPDAKFVLSSSQANIGVITSDTYRNVYNDNKWNFAARIVPTKDPIGDAVTGSNIPVSGDLGYEVQFYGINKELDVVKEEFSLSALVKANGAGRAALRSAKRLFAGAHRTNFSGTVLQPCDVKISSIRYWADNIPNAAISAHANDSEVYGAQNSFRNAFATQTSMAGYYVPEIDTLALNWNFYDITGSNASGQFSVADYSSGSTGTTGDYGWLGNIVNSQHLGLGFGFPASSNQALDREYIPQARQALPEVVQSSEMINILEGDDEYFNKESRPINYFFSIEKSMYQVISDEMINAFATIVEFNNLIGDPVNRYRQDYKLMEKARNSFFGRIDNTPNLDKFLDFYKWIDASLSVFLYQLVPASADSSDGVRNLIESHILERNKYWSKFPTLDRVSPGGPRGLVAAMTRPGGGVRRDSPPYTGGASGYGNPIQGGAPIPYVQNQHGAYWKTRASRRKSPLATGVAKVDIDREAIFHSLTSSYKREANRPFTLNKDDLRALHGGINYPQGKKRSLILNATYPVGPRAASGTPLNTALINDTEVVGFVNVTGSGPWPFAPRVLNKRFYDYTIRFRREDETGIKSKNTGSYTSEMKGTIGSPFTLVSSSVTTGYNKPVQQNFMSGAAVVNLHSDTYASNEIPIQGPFTNAHVGGHESRHIPVNRYNSSFASTNKIDSYENRAEAWRIELGTRFLATDPKILGFVGPDYPYPVGPYPYTPFKWAVRYRNVGAKRPVNIRNINYTTASQVLGNYQHNYQVVQTCGRRLNNRYFVDKEGIALPTTPINLKSTLPETNTLSTLLGLKYGADNLGNFVGVKPNGGVLDISDRYELLANFLIPNRSGSSKTKSIFVNRFSAPGGPEVQSLGYLDLAAAEISAYNALPFRNLSVRSSGSGESGTIRVDDQLGKRRGLRTLLTLHAGQFGYDATYGSVPELTYITKPSYQKTNRNRLKEIQFNGTATWGDNSYVTGSVYDNAYISYSIPRSDLQYAWITASYSKSRIYGHTYGNSIVSSSAEGFQQAIDFVQQSHISASTGPGAINVDFANLNTLIYDPLDLANNILSSSTAEYRNTEIATLAQPEMLNGLILHRQGPYGVTAWTQLRNANNTLTRKRRERNIISYVRRSRFSYPLESGAETLSMPKFGPIEDYVESPLVSKFAPLLQKLQVRKMMPDSSVKIVPVSLDTSYAASLSAFNNVPLNNKYNVRQDRPQPYDKIKNLYLDGADENDESPVHKFDSITYRETVYPSALNAYSSSVRVRKDYVSPFWRNNRSDRNLSSITSFGRTITNVSMWSLDADSAFLTRNPFTTKGMTGFPGILQNNYVQIHGGTPAGIEPGPSLGRRNTIGNCQSVTGPEGLMISATGSITRNINTFVALEQDQMFGGQALWEAGTQAKKNPWYNSYDDYVSEMRLKGKEYSIVPEFTISTHIDQYVKDYGGDFLVDNDKFLIMTGGITSKDKSNEDGFYRTYTNSDFLKFFSVVREDHNEIGTPASIALQCRGLLKFLPYDGFYPSERSIDIAQTFSSSYGSFMSYSLGGGITSIEGQQAMLRPLFAPGILYNTIKAGVAVDFPIMTSSVDFHTTANDTSAATGTRYISGSNGTGRFGLRLPFETLVEPETYLADITVVDMETHPSAALDATASWSGDGSPIYKLKANNFFAETINFFLPESKPTTIVSRPQSAWEPAEKDKVYAARIKMRKSYNKAVIRTGSLGYRNPLTPVDQWRGDLHTTFTQCSAPFMYGPPVGAGTANTVAYASADGFNPCFTPPYEYGEAWADVFFTAPAAGKFTIDELLSPTNLAVSFLRIGSDWALGNAKGTALALNTILDGANIEFNSMQLDASMNLFGKAQIKKVTYDPNTGEPISVEDDPNDNAWTIQTKFETPMLNFAKASVTNPTNGSGSVPRCMWMQYGEVPTNPTEGIFISVVDIPPNYIEGALGGDSSLTGSLVELVGLGTEEQRLGEIATARTISEAIVAIPYYEKGSERRFIDISRAEIDKALAPQPTASGSIQHMVDAMQKYVLPPKFDFVTNPDAVDPFAMYIFEFEHTLNRDDLVDIWQGLPPRIGQAFDTTSEEFKSGKGSPSSEIVKDVEIAHPLIVGELLSKDSLPSQLRWMVFKIKQKAKTNYFDMVIKDQLNADNNFNKGKAGEIGRSNSSKQSSPKYGYNWPYDYFSLVELVKLDAEVSIQADE